MAGQDGQDGSGDVPRDGNLTAVAPMARASCGSFLAADCRMPAALLVVVVVVVRGGADADSVVHSSPSTAVWSTALTRATA
jgi:hypothetical protein